MATKSLNKSLHKAGQAKNDEFYAQLGDIADELEHYRDQLRERQSSDNMVELQRLI